MYKLWNVHCPQPEKWTGLRTESRIPLKKCPDYWTKNDYLDPKWLSTWVNCPLSTLVDIHYTWLYRKNKRARQKVSIKEECPHRRSVHKGELYCTSMYHLKGNPQKLPDYRHRQKDWTGNSHFWSKTVQPLEGRQTDRPYRAHALPASRWSIIKPSSPLECQGVWHRLDKFYGSPGGLNVTM